MSDWYAQNSTVNIDSVNEWNAAANGSGAWLTWPPASGDNLYANAKTAIAINVSFNIGTGKISTEAGAGTAGGGFTYATASNLTITANISAGTTACLVITGGTGGGSIVGNITGGSASTAYGVGDSHTSVNIVVTGNILGGGNATAYGYRFSGTSGSVSVTGNLTGGSVLNASGFISTSSGTCTITGNCIGSATVSAGGCEATGSGAITIIGNIINGARGSGAVGNITYSPTPTNYIQYGGSTNYYSDIPAVGNVTEDDTAAGVTGTYHEATEAEVQSGVTFGALSALTGTYSGGGGRPEIRGGNL